MASSIRDRIVDFRRVPAADLLSHGQNWRRHPKAQWDALDDVLAEVGFAGAVLARENAEGRLVLIDGHLRRDLLDSKKTDVPVLILDVDEAEAKKLLATIDPIGAMAETDAALLDELLRKVDTGSEALREMWAGLAKDAGLYRAGAAARVTDPGAEADRAGELRAKWATEVGQRWTIAAPDGRSHHLVIGDYREIADEVIAEHRPSALVWDPPWDAGLSAPSAAWDSILAFGDGRRLADVVTAFGPPTWLFVWDCGSCWFAPNRPLQRMKLCAWYGDLSRYRQDGAHFGEGGGAPRRVRNSRGSYVHHPDPRGTMLADLYAEPIVAVHDDGPSHSKPIDWIRCLIGDCAEGVVFDPCLGTGTTLVACEQLGRVGVGVEIDPGMVAVALERLAAMGLEPAERSRPRSTSVG